MGAEVDCGCEGSEAPGVEYVGGGGVGYDVSLALEVDRRWMMGVLRHVVGVVCELLTIRDPYDTAEYLENRVESKVTGSYIKQNHDMRGRPVEGTHTVWQIQANDFEEASDFVKGTTIAGDKTRSIVRVGPKRYEIDVNEWDTKEIYGDEPPPMSDEKSSCFGCVAMVFSACLGCPTIYYLMWWVERVSP